MVKPISPGAASSRLKLSALRLWCIIELFVFIEMGGSPENLEVIILPDPENSIAEQIQNFEARDLKCSRNDVAAPRRSKPSKPSEPRIFCTVYWKRALVLMAFDS